MNNGKTIPHLAGEGRNLQKQSRPCRLKRRPESTRRVRRHRRPGHGKTRDQHDHRIDRPTSARSSVRSPTNSREPGRQVRAKLAWCSSSPTAAHATVIETDGKICRGTTRTYSGQPRARHELLELVDLPRRNKSHQLRGHSTAAIARASPTTPADRRDEPTVTSTRFGGLMSPCSRTTSPRQDDRHGDARPRPAARFRVEECATPLMSPTKIDHGCRVGAKVVTRTRREQR